ncbi:hypothetical protein NKG05_14955 [Oerskovia sp. M15]
MSTFSYVPSLLPAVIDALDPRPELWRAADHAAEAIVLVRRTTAIGWAGSAATAYGDLVAEVVGELHRADRAADQAVGGAVHYLRTVEAANAEARLG